MQPSSRRGRTGRAARPPPLQLAPASRARRDEREPLRACCSRRRPRRSRRAAPSRRGLGGGGAGRRSPSATVSRRPLPETRRPLLNLDRPAFSCPPSRPRRRSRRRRRRAGRRRGLRSGKLVHVDERVKTAAASRDRSRSGSRARSRDRPRVRGRGRAANFLCPSSSSARVSMFDTGEPHQAPRLHAARL